MSTDQTQCPVAPDVASGGSGTTGARQSWIDGIPVWAWVLLSNLILLAIIAFWQSENCAHRRRQIRFSVLRWRRRLAMFISPPSTTLEVERRDSWTMTTPQFSPEVPCVPIVFTTRFGNAFHLRRDCTGLRNRNHRFPLTCFRACRNCSIGVPWTYTDRWNTDNYQFLSSIFRDDLSATESFSVSMGMMLESTDEDPTTGEADADLPPLDPIVAVSQPQSEPDDDWETASLQFTNTLARREWIAWRDRERRLQEEDRSGHPALENSPRTP